MQSAEQADLWITLSFHELQQCCHHWIMHNVYLLSLNAALPCITDMSLILGKAQKFWDLNTSQVECKIINRFQVHQGHFQMSMFSLSYIIKLTKKNVLCSLMKLQVEVLSIMVFWKTGKPLHTLQISNIKSKKSLSTMQIWNTNFECRYGCNNYKTTVFSQYFSASRHFKCRKRKKC